MSTLVRDNERVWGPTEKTRIYSAGFKKYALTYSSTLRQVLQKTTPFMTMLESVTFSSNVDTSLSKYFDFQVLLENFVKYLQNKPYIFIDATLHFDPHRTGLAKTLFDYPTNVIKQVLENFRIIIFPIAYSQHATLLFLFTREHELILFDPNGNDKHARRFLPWRRIFDLLEQINYKVNMPTHSDNYLHIQREGMSAYGSRRIFSQENNDIDIGGYCATWCDIFIKYFIKNIKLDDIPKTNVCKFILNMFKQINREIVRDISKKSNGSFTIFARTHMLNNIKRFHLLVSFIYKNYNIQHMYEITPKMIVHAKTALEKMKFVKM